jgi:asparagine synthase (glutamine-hydrolysing)
MIADVNLGALLSGGIDSTTIVALMQSMSSKPVQTFSIGFREPKFNEAQHALAIARHLGTDHTELYVTAQDAMAVLPHLPSVYDEPFADPSQIPTFLLSKLARRKVSVALSGDGGDELFIGYKRYTSWLKQWNTRCVRNPLWLRRGQANALKAIGRTGWRAFEPRDSLSPTLIPKWLRLGTLLEKRARGITALSPVEFYACKHAQYERMQDLVQDLGQQPEDSSSPLARPDVWPEVTELVRGMLYMDFACYLADDVLVKVDRASMAVSLEVRCPLLDHRVVELAWSLPLAMRLNQSGGKRILRQVLRRYVPATLTERPKMGFGVPVGDWVRGPLRDWAESLLDEKRLREEGFLRPDAVRRIWHQHLSGWHNHKNLVWNLLMFQAWYEANS